jgi:hypothetical protein
VIDRLIDALHRVPAEKGQPGRSIVAVSILAEQNELAEIGTELKHSSLQVTS